MKLMLDTTISKLKEHFPVSGIHGSEASLRFVTVPKEKVVDTLQYLRDILGFRHLVLLTAVDYIEQGEFQLTYLVHHPEDGIDIGLCTRIDRNHAEMESAHRLWPTLATYQRELREMFGIGFPGSPRVDEEFILEGWRGMPPYRRDFDTKAYAESFFPQREGRSTHDPATFMKEKLYPNE
jgi:NADH-quinone oxidoreductase subunit C